MIDALELFNQLTQVGIDESQAHNEAGASNCSLEKARLVREAQATHTVYKLCDELLAREWPSTDDIMRASDHAQLNAIQERQDMVYERRTNLVDSYHETIRMRRQRCNNIGQRMAEEETMLAEKEMELTERELAMTVNEAELAEKKSKLAEDRAKFGAEVNNRQEQPDDATVQKPDVEKHMAGLDKQDIGYKEFFNAVSAETEKHAEVANATFSKEAS